MSEIVRPKSVGVIGKILIVSLVFGMIQMAMNQDDPTFRALMEQQSSIPLAVNIAMTYITSVIGIIAALAMLKGKNWGRRLFVGIGIFNILLSVLTMKSLIFAIPGAIMFAVYIFFLFRPKANQYFSQESVKTSAPQQ